MLENSSFKGLKKKDFNNLNFIFSSLKQKSSSWFLLENFYCRLILANSNAGIHISAIINRIPYFSKKNHTNLHSEIGFYGRLAV